MGVTHIGLVHCDACGCKVKGFHAVFSIEGMYQRGTHKGCDIVPTMPSQESEKFT